MSIQVENEQATIEEATTILLERLPASKVARLLAAWRVGQGNYLAAREKLFAGETVDSHLRKGEGGERRQVTPSAKPTDDLVLQEVMTPCYGFCFRSNSVNSKD